MKTLMDYPVTFPYGATTPPYSPSRPHRGNDIAAPDLTPIVVGGTQIGLVGLTGLTTGFHCHIQEYLGNGANTRKPQNSFKGGVVVAAGYASDFGNYVTIQTEDGWNDAYCHLSRIDVKVGDTIGEDMPNEGDVDNAYLKANGRVATADEKAVYTSKPWSAPDGLTYGKIFVDLENFKNAAQPQNYEIVNEQLYRRK